MTFSPFRHLGSIVWKQRPIQFTFFLTRRCNARCPFCFYISKQDRESTAAAELSPEEIEKFAPQLGKLLCARLAVVELLANGDAQRAFELLGADHDAIDHGIYRCIDRGKPCAWR